MGELGDFLRSRRARVSPESAGLPGSARRRTPGLRREELAALAGVSVDYYRRLEQGSDRNPGDAVLAALADVLRLDADERAHLLRLARIPPATRAVPAAVVRPGLRQLLAAVRPSPAFLLDPVGAIVDANPEGLRLLTGLEDWPPAGRNVVRYVFCHPAARDLFGDWEAMARDCVAHLRTVGGHPRLTALVDELGAASEEFAALWQHYDVRAKTGSRRVFRHPEAGRFELTSEILTAPGGLRLAVFQPQPGTPAADAVALLGLAAAL